MFAACSGPGLDESRHPTGSQTISTSSDYSALYIANTAERTVTRLPVDGTPVEIDVPGEPTRIARAEDRVFVSLRGQRSIGVLVDDGTGLDLETTIPTGAEPFGVVTSEDGERLYVAEALAGVVKEIDIATLEVLRSWEVADEPRWLALHPAGVLYVGSAFHGTFTWIDLDNGKVHATALPQVFQLSEDMGLEVELQIRITGDMAISPDGEYAAIPAMYLDTTTPVLEPVDGEIPEERPIDVAPSDGYAGGATARFNPTVAMVQIEGDGEPQLEDAELVQVITSNVNGELEGYPSSVTISPDGRTTYATIEGGAGIAAFPTRRADDDFSNGVFGPAFREATESFGGRGFSNRKVIAISTDAGPRGVAFTEEDDAFVYNFLDRTVQNVNVPAVARELYSGDGVVSLGGGTRGETTLVTKVELPSDVAYGRRLFYSTNDTRMSAQSSGLSCATCHFDSRADGLTWVFDRSGPLAERQTPSLAGKVSQTEPVRWQGERNTVSDDVRVTSQGLMGGSGITENEIYAVSAFIDWTPFVDSPLAGSADPSVLRGKEIFERPEVGCANCHSGARYTDNQHYDLFGVEGVKTRSLTGIAGSPPYLHDGSARTLRDVVERSRDGSMGNTSSLTDEEMDFLVAYLRSL
jgi:DNA-binding beta-propeller fold protein YncE